MAGCMDMAAVLDVAKLILALISQGEKQKALEKVRAARQELLDTDWSGRLVATREIIVNINEWRKLRNKAEFSIEQLNRQSGISDVERNTILKFYDDNIRKLVNQKNSIKM
jgi:hypothetical protein